MHNTQEKTYTDYVSRKKGGKGLTGIGDGENVTLGEYISNFWQKRVGTRDQRSNRDYPDHSTDEIN